MTMGLSLSRPDPWQENGHVAHPLHSLCTKATFLPPFPSYSGWRGGAEGVGAPPQVALSRSTAITQEDLCPSAFNRKLRVKKKNLYCPLAQLPALSLLLQEG